MKQLALALLLGLAASPALAATCVAVPDDGSTHYVQNETQLMLCRQAAVSDTMRLRQQQIDLQSALQAQQLKFDFELKMQQLQNATTTMPAMPGF